MFSLHYLIMKFLGYVIYLMADLNDIFTKFCLNNLISYVIYIWLYFFFSNSSLLSYVVRIFFFLAIHKMILNELLL